MMEAILIFIFEYFKPHFLLLTVRVLLGHKRRVRLLWVGLKLIDGVVVLRPAPYINHSDNDQNWPTDFLHSAFYQYKARLLVSLVLSQPIA